ncbi:MAG: hypothetical protein L3J41_12660 [Melioribacteraceae bacterium]|nr:hypothetical protein [Melioribacteraceae bacterium]
MNLQSQKISFVQEFLNLQSEETILLFEELLRKSKRHLANNELHPMTFEEFNKRIDISLEDSKEGRLIESEELLSEIEKWS